MANLIVVLLICKAASFGLAVDDKPQCAVGAPGVVEARRIEGVFEGAGQCAVAGQRLTAPFNRDAAPKSLIATWQCLTVDEVDKAGVK